MRKRILFKDHVRVLRTDLVQSGPYGKKRDWSTYQVVFDGRACVQPNRMFGARSPERETAQERLLVYFPQDTDIVSTDRIDYAGSIYDVDGYPLEWRHRRMGYVVARAWKAVH